MIGTSVRRLLAPQITSQTTMGSSANASGNATFDTSGAYRGRVSVATVVALVGNEVSDHVAVVVRCCEVIFQISRFSGDRSGIRSVTRGYGTQPLRSQRAGAML